MEEAFRSHIYKNFPQLEAKKLLLACSGGLDSMVMLSLFQKLEATIAVAHCNFMLRAMESFEDQMFIENYSKLHDIPLYTNQFDTETFAKDNKLSTQVAARELRYNWFYELLENEKFDYILTAHHADDSIETFLIHLVRGSGIDGFTGIPVQNGRIIRPLLLFSRDEIKQYAMRNAIHWREDSSNASDKYLRNKIRHHVVPLLKELNPDFLTSFSKTQSYLQESKDMIDDASMMVYNKVAKEVGLEIHFDLNILQKTPNYKSYLYHWLRKYGFSAWEDMYDLVQSQSGKQVFSKEYRLLKNRGFLILAPNTERDEWKEYLILKNQETLNHPVSLTLCEVEEVAAFSNHTIFVDHDLLTYPLVVRKWQEGDSFMPLGMNGQTKKVSKFFKDAKLSLLDKENTWLLCSNDTIVWIVGKRQDERFKINDTTKNILKIQEK